MAYSFKFNSGPTFNFLAMATSTGAPLSIPDLIEEVLETSGISGHRWRTVNAQHQPFEVVAIASAVDFAAALALANAYKSARLGSQLGTLTDGAISLSDVHVLSIAPRPVPGQVVASSIGADQQASVVSTWLLEVTTFPASVD